MSDPIIELLAGKGWLLADGATGTALINSGFSARKPSEACNLEQPELLAGHYKEVISAGCDVFLTNSFGANRLRLASWGADADLLEINRTAAEIACAAAAGSGRIVQVAGCLGPSGEILAPIGSYSLTQATELYHEQAEALQAGGVTFLWAETLSSLTEVRAVAEAARLTGMSWAVTLSFDTAGRTMMGAAPGQFIKAIEGLRHQPVAIGANCGTGPSELLTALAALSGTGTDIPLIAKANAGVPHARHGVIGYDGTPELMAEYALLARDLGASIIGGCCGSTVAHLTAMNEALNAAPPSGSKPDAQQIAERLRRQSGL